MDVPRRYGGERREKTTLFPRQPDPPTGCPIGRDRCEGKKNPELVARGREADFLKE